MYYNYVFICMYFVFLSKYIKWRMVCDCDDRQARELYCTRHLTFGRQIGHRQFGSTKFALTGCILIFMPEVGPVLFSPPMVQVLIFWHMVYSSNVGDHCNDRWLNTLSCHRMPDIWTPFIGFLYSSNAEPRYSLFPVRSRPPESGLDGVADGGIL